MSRDELDQDEAVNLLSLDGGGVRGVSSLVILDRIMNRIKDKYQLKEAPKPCDIFHIIAGTSTGGLIAIMLGRLRMSTADAIKEYDNCAARIFSAKNRKIWRGSLSDKFRATALEEVVRDIVTRRGMGQKMYDETRPEKGKAFVCTMPCDNINPEPILIRTYKTPDNPNAWDDSVTIWEAARATTAASTFFKPQRLGTGLDAHEFIDAAIGVNNPVDQLLREAVLELGSGRRLGCVVSIGTGTRHTDMTVDTHGIRAPKFIGKVVGALKNTATDSERPHQLLQTQFKEFPNAYFRFNVPEAAEKVKLHHYKRIEDLKRMTNLYLDEEDVSAKIDQLAEGLQNDSFDHGATLGHVAMLDREQVVLANVKIRQMGSPCPYFTGREDILKRLDEVFAPRDTERSRREFLLFGLPGIGKSEIATKFATRREAWFKYLFWIDGTNQVTIDQSYALIARNEGLGEGTTKAMKQLALDWMARLTDEWLMIFDNYSLENRSSELPGRGKGNIIYTSQQSSLVNALGAENVFQVPPLPESEALLLLLRVSGLKRDSLEKEQLDAAQGIVKELGCSPQAVEKTGAYLRDGYSTLERCLERIQAEKVRLTTDPDFSFEDVEILAVYAALELCGEAIMRIQRRRGRGGHGRVALVALKILRLLSFYHPQNIPIMMLERAARERRASDADVVYPLVGIDRDLEGLVTTDEEGEWSNGNFYAGLKLLWRFSLVTVRPQTMTVSMHGLVQRWAQFKIPKEERSKWRLAARILLSESMIPGMRLNDKQFAREQHAHVDSCFGPDMLCQPIDHQEYEARLHHKLGWYYTIVKQFDLAQAELEEAFRIFESLGDKYFWGALEPRLCLAQMFHETGRWDDAEKTYWDMIHRLEKRIENLEASLGSPEDNQTSAEAAEGDQDGHSQQQRRDTTLGRLPETLKRWITLNHLKHHSRRISPRSLTHDNKLKKRNGVNPLTNISGLAEDETPHQLDTIDTLYNILHGICAELAYVLLDQGKPKNGKRMLLTMVERLGPYLDEHNPELLKHKYHAQRLTDPKNTAWWKQQIDYALSLTGEARKTFFNHDCFYALMLGYSYSFLANEQWTDALVNILETKLAVFKTYGPSDRRMLELTRLHVKAKIGLGDYDDAIRLARECVDRAEATYGRAHKETVLALEALVEAVAYQNLDFDDQCRDLMQDALRRAEQAFGETHPTTKRIARVVNLYNSRNHENTTATATTHMNADQPSESPTKAFVTLALSTETPATKRLEALADIHNSAKTPEELLAQLRETLGPKSTVVRELEANIAKRDAGVAQLLLSVVFESSTMKQEGDMMNEAADEEKGQGQDQGKGKGREVVPATTTPPPSIISAAWEGLERKIEMAVERLGPESPVSVGLKGLVAEGAPKHALEFLERVKGVFGAESTIAMGVEEGLKQMPTGSLAVMEQPSSDGSHRASGEGELVAAEGSKTQQVMSGGLNPDEVGSNERENWQAPK